MREVIRIMEKEINELDRFIRNTEKQCKHFKDAYEAELNHLNDLNRRKNELLTYLEREKMFNE